MLSVYTRIFIFRDSKTLSHLKKILYSRNLPTEIPR